MLKNFVELTEKEKLECYKFVKEKKKNSSQGFDDFIRYCCGEEFNNGKNYFAAIKDNSVEGVIGVITKEVPVRKEAFIFNFHGKEDALGGSAELLKRTVKVCIEAGSPIAKLGIGPASDLS